MIYENDQTKPLGQLARIERNKMTAQEIIKELKPCPFCGAHVQYEEDLDAITCAHAKDGCGFTYNCDSDFNEAAKLWNRRAENPASQSIQESANQEIIESFYKVARNAVAYVGAANYAERESEAMGWLRDAKAAAEAVQTQAKGTK